MIDGLLNGAATMEAAAARLDAASANLANARTPGYKRLLPVLHGFASVLNERLGGEEVVQVETTRDEAPGIGESTGNPFDIMIEGQGWLAVQTERGVRYTRAGALTLAPDGTLSTKRGDPVLGESGPLRLAPGGVPPKIDPSGVVHQGENTIGRLKIVRFEGDVRLEPEGAGLVRRVGGKERAAEGVRVLQGQLERSNVDPVLELVDMIKALRLFEAAGNSVKTQDRTLAALMRAV